ncbi:TPA: molecular chaperone DnaJ [Escherichia coli]
MITITKERLLTIKQWRETYGPGSNVVLPAEEAEELARIALASLEAEPVAWKWRLTSLFDGVQIGPWRVCLAPLSPGKGDGCKTEAIPLYTAPPVPVVPAALPENDDEDGHDIDYLEPSEVYALGRTSGWNACRAAMLHSAEPVSQAYKLNALAGNSPVTPDGWVIVPKKLTAENGAKGVLSGEFSETTFISCPECFGDDDCETCDGSGRIEIKVPVSWTTIKTIWAKGCEYFSIVAPQQDG